MHKRSVVQKEKRKRGRPPKNKNISEKNLGRHTEEAGLGKFQKLPEAKAAVLADAPETSYFLLCNGQPVKNIKELADVMEVIEDQVFNHHVTPEKNDFAIWVKDIFKDIELAEKLAGVKDKKNMQLVLYKHIAHKLW